MDPQSAHVVFGLVVLSAFSMWAYLLTKNRTQKEPVSRANLLIPIIWRTFWLSSAFVATTLAIAYLIGGPAVFNHP